MTRPWARPLHMRQAGKGGHLRIAVTNILRWCPPAQGLVRPDGVVDLPPDCESRPNRGQIKAAIVALPEHFGMGAMGPFHMAIKPLSTVSHISERAHRGTSLPFPITLFLRQCNSFGNSSCEAERAVDGLAALALD